MREVAAEPGAWWLAPETPGTRTVSSNSSTARRGDVSRGNARRFAAALFAAAAVAAISAVLASPSGANRIWNGLDRLAIASGLGIEQVSIAGHRVTHDGDVFDALGPSARGSILAFEIAAARARVEALPWVAAASVTRVYPNRIDIRLTERRAFAVWRRGEEDVLIDATGRVLSRVLPGSSTALPHVAGDGAAEEAASVMALLRRYPDVERHLFAAERVAGRRWTLHLDDGTILVLPPDREAVALDTYRRMAGHLGAGGAIVDLRVPARITVRASGKAARTRAGGSG